MTVTVIQKIKVKGINQKEGPHWTERWLVEKEFILSEYAYSKDDKTIHALRCFKCEIGSHVIRLQDFLDAIRAKDILVLEMSQSEIPPGTKYIAIGKSFCEVLKD